LGKLGALSALAATVPWDELVNGQVGAWPAWAMSVGQKVMEVAAAAV